MALPSVSTLLDLGKGLGKGLCQPFDANAAALDWVIVSVLIAPHLLYAAIWSFPKVRPSPPPTPHIHTC